MNRRNFISSLSAAVTGAVLDEDRLLWVPGKTVYSIPLPTPRTGVIKLNFYASGRFHSGDFMDTLDDLAERYTGRELLHVSGVRLFEEWTGSGRNINHDVSSYMVPCGFKGDLSKISQVVDVDVSDMSSRRQWRHDPLSGLMVKNV